MTFVKKNFVEMFLLTFFSLEKTLRGSVHIMAIYLRQLVKSLRKGETGHCFVVKEEGVGLVKKTLDEENVDLEIRPYKEKNYKLLILGRGGNA